MCEEFLYFLNSFYKHAYYLQKIPLKFKGIELGNALRINLKNNCLRFSF